MTIEAKLAQLQQAAAEQTSASLKLANDVVESINEIDQVKVDINQTHELIKSNHQAINDWQTKTGKVTLKDFQGQSYQVDTLPSLINETQKINPHPEAMTKAQFDALRQIRKQQYAGSGFVQWGKSYTSAKYAINEGMHAFGELNQGRLVLGPATNTPVGNSKTLTPTVLVDGVQHSLGFIKAANDLDNNVYFPPAPDGTKTYDSVTGKVTQHTSAAEAFNECRHKTPNGLATGDYNKELGELTFQQTDAGGLFYVNKNNSGAHALQVVFSSSIDTNIEFRDAMGIDGAAPLLKFLQASANKKQSVTLNHTFENGGVYFRVPEPQVGQKITIHSWQTLSSSEQVITSRKDFVFLESWHEKIADKDVVYPLGNVQYGQNNYEGISLVSSLVAQSYSAFGLWDTDTKGYGVKWSTLSDANRIKFLKNPEHNIYYDPEAKAYIQVRYRVRVIEGYGDQWNELRPSVHEITTEWAIADRRRITFAQGSSQSITSKVFVMKGHTQTIFTKQDNGVAEGEGTTIGSLSYGQTKPLAMPVAIVQRLNQGAYHPTYNPMGTGKRRISGGYYYHWYETHGELTDINNTQDCFDKNANQGGGNMGQESGWANLTLGESYTGRSDQYKFHDAIYAGQVEDLRLNANKLDVNQLREDALNKAVAGTLRGKGKLMVTRFDSEVYQVGGSALGYVQIDSNGWARPSSVYEKLSGWNLTKNKAVSIYQSASSPHVFNVYMDDESAIEVGDKIMISYYRSEQSAEFDSLPWTDIVGHPERIAATFPNGVIGQWLPKLPNNSYGYPLNKKITDSKLNATYTRDLGETWTNSDVGFDNIKNTSSGSWHPDIVALLSYESPSNFTIAAANTAIKSSVSSVWASADRFVSQGNRFISSLSGVIGKDNQDGNQQRDLAVLNAPNHAGGFLWNSNKVSHSPITLREPLNQSGGAKALPTIVERNGLLYMQFHGSELRYEQKPIIDISESSTEPKTGFGVYRITDGPLKGRLVKRMFSTATAVPFNDVDWSIDNIGLRYQNNTDYSYKFFTDDLNWGDDQIIPIINGENTKTDLNGNTVKVFCHHTQLPLGIASH
ncbi:hypothetical protein PA25_19250 [Pseudoalteromonas sp. A25]|uniref:hypothetical protein n=1 Tax=Pseudoalteromonas sp. A25 TaxID=116092 RepID=UPI0012604923|nr:hypothetical protein [Pseudoalteromonas sp. A25]BBN81940.1 hypothetical protein PA25_19250 [Pseudoalteromonas sp. A25]